MNDSEYFKRDFGAFYPAGYMVVGFRVQMDAKRVLYHLVTAGHQPGGFIELSAQQMLNFAEKNMMGVGAVASHATGLSAPNAVADAAKEGAYFLVLPTPDSAVAERAMVAINRVPFLLAERYHPLASAAAR